MHEYKITPAGKADVDALLASLSTRKIPHAELQEGPSRIVRIGPDNDFEVHVRKGPFGSKSAKVFLRYEQPVLKTLIQEWSDRCGTEIDDEFYTWHMGLSPSVLGGIKARWRVDLTGLPATPVLIGQVVLVFMFSENVDAGLSAQLAELPHRPMVRNEFLEGGGYHVKGDDPFDTTIYGWRSDAGSELFAVISSAPTVTTLSLWVFSEGAPARHNIQGLTERRA